jgi:TonB-linked SusC/RagA family outer membrane protein
MAGYESNYYFYEGLTATKDKFELSDFPYMDIAPNNLVFNSGNAYETALRSFFGRVSYNYKNRYLLQANCRWDGSSRFAKKYRWGMFPSVSGAWVVSEEPFFKLGKNSISYLKVRLSYGTLGNERIGNYPYQSLINTGRGLFVNSSGETVEEMMVAQRNYVIENITWETTQSIDVGLDMYFLNNRLSLTADYYNKKTKDMLLALEIPDYVGYGNPEKNTGDMKTNGFELSLGWKDNVGDFFYGVNFNLSDFKSEMGNLGGTQFLGDQVKLEGSEFNEWYGYVSEGLFLTQEDLDYSPKLNNRTSLGDIKYKDISGPNGVPDGKITPEYDRVLLGGSLPRFTYGGNLNFGYKGIDLSLSFQGVGLQKSRMTNMMVKPLIANYGNIPAVIDGKYWSSFKTAEENAQAEFPRLTYANESGVYCLSDYWLFNGAYFRLKNVMLGYTLPEHITKKAFIKKLRFYATATDLFSISNYPKGWDPEVGPTSYPITTTVLLGAEITF